MNDDRDNCAASSDKWRAVTLWISITVLMLSIAGGWLIAPVCR